MSLILAVFWQRVFVDYTTVKVYHIYSSTIRFDNPWYYDILYKMWVKGGGCVGRFIVFDNMNKSHELLYILYLSYLLKEELPIYRVLNY